MKTFIHSHSSLENRTRFQTKMGEVYTCFQNKTGQNPYPLGRHKPIWVIQYPPGGGLGHVSLFGEREVMGNALIQEHFYRGVAYIRGMFAQY